MDFKKIELSDYNVIGSFLNTQYSRMSDFSCGALYVWAEYLHTQFAVYDDTLYIRFYDNTHKRIAYAYPITQHDIERAIDNIKQREMLFLVAVPQEKLDELCQKYQIEHHFKPQWSDYFYDAQDMREMKGKKFHQKRNHISKFERLYGVPQYETVTSANLSDVLSFLEKYDKGEMSKAAQYEYKKSFEVFRALEPLNLVAGLIRHEGQVIAAAVGEIIGDTLFVHIEKALREYEGAYTVMANQFALQFPLVKYINREDDAGDEGLKKSKLSYNPISMINKYIVKLYDKKQ